MKHYPPRSHRPCTPSITIPPFHAVPLRNRTDGWTPVRQAEFIGLATTRSVAAAARGVSMARETAYRLRARLGAQGFAAAWDVALASVQSEAGRARLDAALEAASAAKRADRKVTIPELEWRVASGLWQVMLRGGRYVGVVRKPDETALLALLSRTRAAAGRA
ncbi:hypothetical protein A3711_01300 [Erythrobacter sp. HI00D59]|nr:hypothetical protein A3711_01300 [Erythrobacter sp. HI00D59]